MRDVPPEEFAALPKDGLSQIDHCLRCAQEKSVNAVFGGTFYWADLTNVDDPANVRPLSISRSLAPEKTVTTDEVQAEYLTFFAFARSHIRDRVGRNVVALLESFEVRIVP